MKTQFKGMMAALMCASLAACSSSTTATTESTTVSASSKGFGGDVTVTLTVTDDKITEAAIDAPDETESIGQAAVETLQEQFVEAGNCDIDGVSGATMTSTAARNACKIALGGEESTDETAALTDGTYHDEAQGFGLTMKLGVTVTVEDGKIASITVDEENSETASQLQSAVDTLIPRIIEYQSVGIDGVTGATGSSSAIKNAVLGCVKQAGGDELTYSKTVEFTPQEDKEYTADVVVVGFGGSGATAALAAAENGAKVIAIEKAAKIGGTSAVTGGPMSVNMPSQVAAELTDWTDPTTGEVITKAAGDELVDADALYEDWINYTTVDGVQGAKTDIIRETIDESGETSDWLIDNGFEFIDAIGFLGGQYAIYTPYEGNKALTQGFFEILESNFEDLGGEVLLETDAQSLVYDEDGNIIGVEAVQYDGTKVTVYADKVILATGGFGGSAELEEEYLGEDWMLYGMAQNTGAGIEMAVDAGAATYNIDMYPMSHFAAPTVITNSFDEAFDNDVTYAMVSTSETLAVNKSGERFLNEARIQYNAYVGGSRFYTIYSSDMIDTLKEQGFALDASGRYLNHFGVGGVPTSDVPIENMDAILENGINQGFIYKASSLEELAEMIYADNGQMDADTLIENVQAYNAGIESGEDAFGKDASCTERLGTINEDAEYYIAVTGAPYIYSTCGGLDVDADMHVLDTDGNIIDGLYAVGTDSMGVLFTNQKGYANYGGVAQGYCFTSGRIAGTDAANSLN